jgi:hypothetical protein
LLWIGKEVTLVLAAAQDGRWDAFACAAPRVNRTMALASRPFQPRVILPQRVAQLSRPRLALVALSSDAFSYRLSCRVKLRVMVVWAIEVPHLWHFGTIPAGNSAGMLVRFCAVAVANRLRL